MPTKNIYTFFNTKKLLTWGADATEAKCLRTSKRPSCSLSSNETPKILLKQGDVFSKE